MSKANKNIMWILSVISYIGVLICYPRLPEQIPLQWNIRWEINSWGNKNHILLLGLIPFLLLLTFDRMSKYNRNGKVGHKHIKVYQILKSSVIILIILLNWVTIMIGMGYDIKLKFILPVLLGIFFIFFGNYMPALKSNYFMGIRNPWTLLDEFVWRKTHKVGGYLFIAIGIFMILMSFIKNNSIHILIFAFIIAGIVVINLYSYLLYRKERKKIDSSRKFDRDR